MHIDLKKGHKIEEVLRNGKNKITGARDAWRAT